ncbi:MAG: B12-binding domain-containing radical SAM protein [Elusimicrobia bacterium]|nr:B12-binding domain-containing radical SAM protein [Elusimicrobiota bacterium]
MLKVAVVQCPSIPAAMPPTELAQLAGCVAYCNHSLRVIDLNVRSKQEGWHRDQWADEVLAGGPDVVVLSVPPGAEDASLALASRMKSVRSAAQVVLTGSYFSQFERAEELASSRFDAIVGGPIEDLIPKLLGLFEASGDWTALPGVVAATREGVKSGGRPVPFTFDLDLAPYMDFSGFRAGDYERPTHLPMVASRGCPWRCDFCAPRERWAKHSFKSGDRIFSEIAYARKQQPTWRHVEFTDIMANGSVDSLVRFSEMAVENGLPSRGITWRMQAAPKPDMTPEALEAFARAGCAEIVYGLESGSPKTLKAMGKPIAVAETERVLRDTRSAGIRTVGTLIVGHPAEADEDFEATLGFLRRAKGALDRVVLRAIEVQEPSVLWRGGAVRATEDVLRGRITSLAEVAASAGMECEVKDLSGTERPAMAA